MPLARYCDCGARMAHFKQPERWVCTDPARHERWKKGVASIKNHGSGGARVGAGRPPKPKPRCPKCTREMKSKWVRGKGWTWVCPRHPPRG